MWRARTHGQISSVRLCPLSSRSRMYSVLGHHPGRMLSDLLEQASVCRVNNFKIHVTARGRCYVPTLGSAYRQGELGKPGALLSLVGVSLCPPGFADVSQTLPVPFCRTLSLPHSQIPGHRLKCCKLKGNSLKSPHFMSEMLGSSSERVCDTTLQPFCLDSVLCPWVTVLFFLLASRGFPEYVRGASSSAILRDQVDDFHVKAKPLCSGVESGEPLPSRASGSGGWTIRRPLSTPSLRTQALCPSPQAMSHYPKLKKKVFN